MPPNDLTIRRTTLADLDMLSALIAASYATLDDGSYDRAQLQAAMPVMSKANPKLVGSGSYYLVEADGMPAGCGGWSVPAPWTGEIAAGVGHIRHFAVHPDFKRRGVAGMLLTHCLDEARAHGVILMKSQSSLPGVPFYQSFGFRRVGQVMTDVGGNPLPAIEMELMLS
jgi:GNAT superfamily N-acetyltransferase